MIAMRICCGVSVLLVGVERLLPGGENMAEVTLA